MTPKRARRTWLLDEFFAVLTFLMVAVGFSVIAITGQMTYPVYFLFLIPFLGHRIRLFREKFQLSSRGANLCTWFYLPFFIADMVSISKSFVPATLHLILFIQILKIYQQKNQRDYIQLMLLSFLQVLAASSLTISSWFLVLFLIHVFLSLAALICIEVKRNFEDLPISSAGVARHETSVPTGTLRVEFEPKVELRAVRSILNTALVSLSLIFIFGPVLFFAIPRIGAGYFQRSIGRKLVLSGFSDRIRLGNIGAIQLDPSVVMRVKVQGDPARFQDRRWRGVTLDYFDGKSWSKRVRGATKEFSYAKQFQVREPPPGRALFQYQVLLEPASTNYLFTLDRIAWLGGNLYPVRFDPADDSITASYRTNRRLSYQAVSVQTAIADARETSGLQSKQARTGYLQLPASDGRILRLARDITAHAITAEEKARQIELYLQKNCLYSLDADLVENPQPLSRFLFEDRKGHCEYFATAMVVLLRSSGIPARVVNGFRGGEYNTVGTDFIFRGKDAHSWVEAYVPGTGWQTYDPTPTVQNTLPQSPFMAAFNNYLDAFELFWGEWVLGYDDISQVALFRDLQEKSSRWWEGTGQRIRIIEARTRSLARNHGKDFLEYWHRNRWAGLWFLVIIPCWLGLKAFRHLVRDLRLQATVDRREIGIALKFYRDLLSFLRSRGVTKPPCLTPNEFAESIRDPLLRSEVIKITSLYNQIRFSPDPINREQVGRAHQLLSELRAHAKRRGPQ
ncbi:MAG TPA: DUF3488 and transglutaminase-like domain-containing protein [Terriglobia bacterium]|nr:DUF3488 and transglutaminase-like domain-containing protein [Terriglobia bacterium]